MKASPYLLRALNVRKGEWWLVQRLFLLQFFQGAGIAFFFTSAFSRFLKNFPVSGLAYVFIISSGLLWIAGYIYNKLEHRLPPARLYVIITAVLAASMLLFRGGGEFIGANWFYYLMLAWFYVLYLLNNLMFWGMASQLYDVRQSKRLFSVISAGDIPAKFIGYSVASIIVYYTGTLNLLIVGFLFIMSSFPFLKNIITAGKHGFPHYDSPKHVSKLHSIVKDYTINFLVRRVALLSLIVSASIILINYGFYAEVKHAFYDDVKLANFIAMFLAIARLVAMLIKIIFTSRLLYWLGNRISLLVTPVLLIILVGILLLTGTMTFNAKIVLYIFGLSAIAIDVLNSAINSPVLLTMMQPLSTHERLRAHNIVKGIMDPFAYFLCGIFLLAAFKSRLYSLEILGIVLVSLAIAWIINIFRVHGQYLKTLIKTISSRYFSQEEFDLVDTTTRDLIEEKIVSGSELEVLYILNMLGSRSTEESTQLLIRALQHPAPKVVSEAMRLVAGMHIREAEPFLSAIIEKHPDDHTRSEAIKVLSKINFHDAVIVPLMYSENKKIRQSAIVSIMNHSKVSHHTADAELKIRELFASENIEEKKEAAEILCETNKESFDEQLIQLSDHPDKKLQLASIRAMGINPSPPCLEQLIKKIEEHEKPVLEALMHAGEKSLPFINKRILSDKSTAKQKENLMNTIGRIGSKASQDILLDLMHALPAYRPFLVKVLHRCHFKSGHGNQKFVESVIRDNLVNAAAILHMQKRLSKNEEKYRIMLQSLRLELDEIRDSLLYLFSFLYDQDKISKVKSAMEINKKETLANAFELVDMTVKKEFANPFITAFEYGDLEHRCALLKYLFPKDIFPGIESILAEILRDKNMFYNNWSKACSLYVSKKLEHPVEKELILKYMKSENILLKETAGFAIQNN